MPTRRRRRLHHNRRSQLTRGHPPQRVRGHLLIQPNPEVPTARLHLLGDPHRRRPAERAIADTQHTLIQARRPTRIRNRAIDLGQRLPRTLEQHRTRRSQLHPPRRPHEQHQPELTLELTNRPRERRLRHMQALRRPPEVQLPPPPPRNSATAEALPTDPHADTDLTAIRGARQAGSRGQRACPNRYAMLVSSCPDQRRGGIPRPSGLSVRAPAAAHARRR
jgi:hypothetical protein